MRTVSLCLSLLMNIQIPLFDSRKDVDISFKGDIPFIVNFSGGKDSLALLLWVKSHYPTNPIVSLYNDTGFEHPGVLEYIQEVTHQVEVPLIVLDSPGLLNIVKERGDIPGFGCRFCTSSLKREPASAWIRRNFPSGKVINCFGFRAEESFSRSKKLQLSRYERLCTLNREVLNFSPLLDWKTYDIVEFVKSQGFRLFHVYEYLSRLSCRYCFLSGKRSQEAVRINDPEGFFLVSEILESIGYSKGECHASVCT